MVKKDAEISGPPSHGPTCASPYGTASTAGALPELDLPPPSLKERRVSSELMVFMDPVSGQPSPVRDLSGSCVVNADAAADADADDAGATSLVKGAASGRAARGSGRRSREVIFLERRTWFLRSRPQLKQATHTTRQGEVTQRA